MTNPKRACLCKSVTKNERRLNQNWFTMQFTFPNQHRSDEILVQGCFH